MVIRFVKTGVIDQEEMRQRIEENDAALAKRKREEKIERAWDLYTKTLRPNEDEVVKALHEAHIAAIEDVSTGSVSQAVWVMRQLGHEAEADDLTEKFLNRSTPVGTYSDYPFEAVRERSRR
jgi:hypothetical protein